MRELIGSMLDNESAFGRLMTRLGIIIGANLMFVFFSMPVITLGPALVALYHVMLKTLREGSLNPFSEYWKAFRANFKQSMIFWMITLFLGIFFFVDFRIVFHTVGFIHALRYPMFAMAVVFICLFIYTCYAMAAFEDSIPHLMRNGVYLMMKNPLGLITILFFHTFPLYLTYSDPQMMPLYGFVWVSLGFGLVALIGAAFLLPLLEPYLIPTEEEDSYSQEPSEEEVLEMMLKLGM